MILTDKSRSTPSDQDRYVAFRTQDNNGVYVAIDSINVQFPLPAEGKRSEEVISLGSNDNQPGDEPQLQGKLSYGVNVFSLSKSDKKQNSCAEIMRFVETKDLTVLIVLPFAFLFFIPLLSITGQRQPLL
jgi:hypothetical protein